MQEGMGYSGMYTEAKEEEERIPRYDAVILFSLSGSGVYFHSRISNLRNVEVVLAVM